MHRLKLNPFNGLYAFSENLGRSLAKMAGPEEELHYYLPREKFGFFGDRFAYENHRSIDKFYKFGTEKFDVWHATTTISWYRPFNKRTKFLFTIHDLNFLLEEKELVTRNKNLLQRIQRSVDRAAYVVCISNYSMRIAEEMLKMGDKPRCVIHNGCIINTFPDFDEPVYRPKRPFLFALGLVQPRKNFHLLPALLKDTDLELVIAGLDHYEYKRTIEAEIRKYGVEDRVHFTGGISEQDKHWYYQHCEAFLLPSFAEGFGLPVIEAMYYGKPVFLSRESCLPETGGDAAYYFNSFDPDDMRQTFAKGLAHYREHDPAEKIRRQAALFSWDKAAESYLQIYRSL